MVDIADQFALGIHVHAGVAGILHHVRNQFVDWWKGDMNVLGERAGAAGVVEVKSRWVEIKERVVLEPAGDQTIKKCCGNVHHVEVDFNDQALTLWSLNSMKYLQRALRVGTCSY